MGCESNEPSTTQETIMNRNLRSAIATGLILACGSAIADHVTPDGRYFTSGQVAYFEAKDDERTGQATLVGPSAAEIERDRQSNSMDGGGL